ncbi:MAG: hypothetical protein ACI4XW_09945 [Candidatus Spyradocola sp.]
MKRTLALVLTLLLCCMGLTVYADSATISTTVPGTHTITVIEDGADVFCDGSSADPFTVERLSQPKLLIRAQAGREIEKVTLNGVDITDQIKGGYYTLEPIYEDKELVVTTKEAPIDQGKTYTVQGKVLRNGEPVKDVTLELRSPLKTAVTTANGRFTFVGVACGKRSLTAIENGEIVGYVEFVLTEGTDAVLTCADGVYTVTVKRTDAGIELTLSLDDNGGMTITGVEGVRGNWFYPNYGTEQKPDSDSTTTDKSPQTGDSANLLLWLAGIFAAAGMLAAVAHSRSKNAAR